MDIVVIVGQFLLAISILVGVHELGHMLSAKYFGMRVEKYFIGFPPKIFSFKKGETEYGLGSIPLGGFVKISGMIDESLDTASMAKDPEPHEFRAKPAWQRLIVMMGGIIVNVFTGIIIYIMILLVWGEKYYATEEVNKRGIVAYEIGKKIGLQTGDKIIQINGKDYQKYNEIVYPDVLWTPGAYYVVQRGDSTFKLNIPEELINDISKGKESFVAPVTPYAIAKIMEGSNAEKAGLKPKDVILKVNNVQTEYFHQLRDELSNNKDKKVQLTVLRDGKEMPVAASVSPEGTLGFEPEFLLPESVETFGFGQAVVKGTEKAFTVVILNVQGIWKMIQGRINPVDSVGGPISIAKMYGSQWIWERFWAMTAMISMILAFMNFLPIPALDGGHVMFLTWEIVTGRKPSDKFLENAQKVGMVILLALMVFAFGNDFLKMFR